MRASRIVAAAVAAALLGGGLSGCVGIPFLPRPHVPSPAPTTDDVDPASIDADAIQEAIAAVMPEAPDDFEVVDYTDLDEGTFGSDWSSVDHDAQRVVRVLHTTESPGWQDFSVGPAFWVDFEIVRMESTIAADATMNDLASAIDEPYTNESDDGQSQTEYAPLSTPSGRWPFGALEQERRQTWSDGSRATGWTVYYGSGPYIAVVTSAANPDDASLAALDAYADERIPSFVQGIQSLPGD